MNQPSNLAPLQDMRRNKHHLRMQTSPLTITTREEMLHEEDHLTISLFEIERDADCFGSCGLECFHVNYSKPKHAVLLEFLDV